MAPHPKDAPPPYSKHPTEGTATIATGSQDPPPFAAQRQNQPPIPRQFPPAFNMYIESRQHYHIGEHQAAPLYAVTLARPVLFSSSSRPDVLLHCGPSHQSPALAAVERVGFDRCLTVTLPPLLVAGSGSGAGAGAGVQERVETPTGFGDGPYTFVVEAGPGQRREAFAWRRSRGETVEALGGRASGWKLVRLRTDAPSGLEGPGRAVFAGGGACAGDGKEVVAVWAWATMSLTKKLRFRFLGSGVSGVLGERWAVMAVATALWIFERERRQKEDR
ncbi:uncharacterized protein F4812DRAFT_467593 [Daldinia caldariorum]|uniref:uncharacterized protein n=1 Tax=Daldinia caldariorum TaxID=326644 RepID=UPI0020088FC4|nr:uncharacterized protein F4812DRAFT_467593 [Daldinia caldariorum]KAI1471556.1 hypothetical protein F4812DRAFT_467593 [Daldinia caldariorum]